ncbi:hypothetical protein LIER_01965 [Lithospermum erythrorhizon]|uniref:Uncharacterized protein n=1 Tax=Lithospermum erythrorhizon TaxID=34254 RepID=A0AAV3NSC0_LITER
MKLFLLLFIEKWFGLSLLRLWRVSCRGSYKLEVARNDPNEFHVIPLIHWISDDNARSRISDRGDALLNRRVSNEITAASRAENEGVVLMLLLEKDMNEVIDVRNFKLSVG